jgi:phage terminase large subunit-like protein
VSLAPFEVDLDAILALPDGPERESALRVAAVIKERVDKNPIWGLRPHGGERERKLKAGEDLTGEESRGQVEYLEQSQRGTYIAAVVAGNRFGKSHIGAADALVQTLSPELVPPWLEPYRRRPYSGDFRCRFVIPDLANALKKVWLPKLRRLVPQEALWGGSWQKAWNDRDRMLQFADGSWWDFLTHDMDVQAFAGTDVDRVHFDEEPPGGKGYLQYDESLTRLIDRDGDVRFTLTPLEGMSWVFYELTSNDVPRKDDEVYVVEGSMEDNPTLSATQQDRLKKRWEKEPLKLEARLHGRFVHFAGLIYDEFREAPPEKGGQVVPPRSIPRRDNEARPSVPVYGAIDPGIARSHMALVFFWVTEDDVAEVFYAQKWKGWLTEDLAREFHRVCGELNFRPRWTVIDPAGKRRDPTTGRNMQDALRDLKVPTMPGPNKVDAGIDEVKVRLRSGRLIVHADLEQLIGEFRNYRWKNTDKSQSEDEPKREPIKANDDLLDALRYGLMSMPAKARKEREDPERGLSAHDRAFRAQLKRFARPKRQRVGSTR